MAEKAPKKEKEHLGSVLDDNHAARMKRGRWVWDHKVAIIVVAVLMFFGFMFREVVWSSLCWTWNAGRSASMSAAERIDSGGDTDHSTSKSANTSTATVKVKDANVRSGAGYSAKVIVTLHKGNPVTLTGQSQTVDEKTWKQVRLENGKTGWMLESLLDLQSSSP